MHCDKVRIDSSQFSLSPSALLSAWPSCITNCLVLCLPYRAGNVRSAGSSGMWSLAAQRDSVCLRFSQKCTPLRGIQSCHVHVAFPMLSVLPVPTPHGDMLPVSQDLLAAQSSDRWNHRHFAGIFTLPLLFKGRRPKSSPCGHNATQAVGHVHRSCDTAGFPISMVLVCSGLYSTRAMHTRVATG